MKAMREPRNHWTWCRGRGAAGALLALLLAPGTALAVAPEKQGGNRAFDARIEHNAGFRAAPTAAQERSVAGLKQGIPDLGVTYDETTGVTRSVVNYVGALTAPQPGRDATTIGLEFVRGNLGLLGLGDADLEDMETTDTVYSAVSGATYVYLRQRHEGLPLYNGQLHFGVDRDGRVMIVNNQFLSGLAAAANAVRPSLSAADAVASAARHLGIDAAAPVARGDADDAVVLDAPGISLEPVTAKLMLLPIRRGEARLVWNFALHTLDVQHVYDMNVDAVDGRVWTRFDWVAADSYTVYNRPVESPIYATPPPPADARTVVLNPSTSPASPFGWHDTNGVAGAEFTITRGNNVEAYPDRFAPDGTGGDVSGPDGGPTLTFALPLLLSGPPSGYVPASVTNLFFWNNIIHDIQYRYGFDTVAGNFQVNQYGGGGLGNDDVRAEAQDFSGTNNANFFTPVDGQRPRMQMYVGTNPTPDVDGDLDNLVIVHEYGHGISNRLVGGPGNVSCLQNNQQPGEGLSDWWGLMYTGEIGDQGTDRRTVGNYLFGQGTGGNGIRPFPYSTDQAINPDTYASVAGRAVPHGVGAVWAQAYWEVYWRLVDNYGFDLDLYNATGNAGNQRAGLYINEGLKATICSPAFTDVRNGIVAAAATLHGGEDVCRLWIGFAAFGLGVDAISGGPGGLSPTNGFQVPASCAPAAPLNLTATATGANTITVSWSATPTAVTYNVFRADGACPQTNFTQIATGVTTTTFDDTNVVAGLTYAYVVTAVDSNGLESGFSNCDDAMATAPPTATAPFALVVDGPGNGVMDANENVAMAPTWRNTGAGAIVLTGTLTSHNGPAGGTYLIHDSSAVYGTVAPGATASCTNCYTIGNSATTRPLTHWDSVADELMSPTGATKAWTLHIGNSFTDVPTSNGFYRFVETILHNNVTVGCTTDAYCPTSSTTREAMAAFVLVAKDPTAVPPPNCVAGAETFTDVPASSPFCRWIEELFRRGVVTGCAPNLYCPTSPATREQMAVFVLRTLDGTIDPPPCVAGSERFDDVPASSGFCRWIEELASRGVVTGCSATSYCPAADVTREQMSVFLAVTFGLTLYGI